MDMKKMLESLSQLSEAKKETEKGVIHKADPGGYGRKFDTDEEGDEKDDKKKAAPAEKRGRGRPKKLGGDADTAAKYGGAKDLQSYIVGNLPKGKLPGKATKKHSLKEWVEEVEAQYVSEAEQVVVEPAKQNTQVIRQGQKTLGTVTNPQLAAQIKQSIGKGEMSLAGSELGEGDEDYSAKKARAGKDIGKPGKQFAKIAKGAAQRYGSEERGKKVAGAVLAKLRAKTNEADIPSAAGVDTKGANLGAGRSDKTLESKGSKPDYPDIDNDGNEKESIKKAAADKKKKVAEGMSHRLHAARLEGKSHGLRKEGYNCRYDDMEEARAYHEGYKEGLDECYGQMAPAVMGETDLPATVPGMADQADGMGEGNAFTGALAKTPQGGKFSLGGKTFTDTSSIDEMNLAFESLDRQLNALLNESEKVEEGMTVSISKGQQGAPDSVTVSAQDGEADALLSLIKQAGLGLFGDEQQSGYGAPQDTPTHGDIAVVDDHEGMMSLMKKLAGGEMGGEDYKDEEGQSDEFHDHGEEGCDVCGEAQCQCDSGEEMVDETETEDQMMAQVAEDDSEEEETTADEESEAEEDEAVASADEAEDEEEDEEEGEEEEQLDEWANDAGEESKDFDDEQFQTDMDFMTKVISGGLNKPKSTGQTTTPVIAGQKDRMGYEMQESISDWKKLAGL